MGFATQSGIDSGTFFASAIKMVSSHNRYLFKVDLGFNCQQCAKDMYKEKVANHARVACDHFRTRGAIGGSKRWASKRALPFLYDEHNLSTVLKSLQLVYSPGRSLLQKKLL
jgi:hypothetical protein